MNFNNSKCNVNNYKIKMNIYTLKSLNVKAATITNNAFLTNFILKYIIFVVVVVVVFIIRILWQKQIYKNEHTQKEKNEKQK